MARERLVMALMTRSDGMFADLKLGVDNVRRQLGDLIKTQRMRNKEAFSATGRGGTQARTEVEELSQRLVDMQDELAEEKGNAKEGRAKHVASLNKEGKENVSRQMETHTHEKKRKKSSTGSQSRSGMEDLVKSWIGKLDAFAQEAHHASLEATRRGAQAQWTREYKLWRQFPEDNPNPGRKEEYVEFAVKAHLKSHPSEENTSIAKVPTVSSKVDEAYASTHE